MLVKKFSTQNAAVHLGQTQVNEWPLLNEWPCARTVYAALAYIETGSLKVPLGFTPSHTALIARLYARIGTLSDQERAQLRTFLSAQELTGLPRARANELLR